MQPAVPYLTLVGAYLVGAVPFGYLIAKGRGVDIFAHGSGNIGATNVGRVLGRRFGLLVFALDFAKGAGPVAAALVLRDMLDPDSAWAHGWLEVGAGLAAFLGHLFPVWLGFRGGKGVATGAGVVAVLLPGPTLAGFLVWALVALTTRYVSLASLLAALALCLTRLAQTWPADVTEPRTLFSLLGVALVVARHRANVGRLLSGQESQLREHPAMPSVVKTLHVLAVGLWFGSAVFFSFVVGLSLFDTFERLGQQTSRPDWFPKPAMYAEATDALDGPKEQGARVAGYAVGPLFGWYFALQGACALVAVLTALAWTKQPGRVHRWRANLLLLALGLVVVGWPLERHVSALRVPRNQATDAYLQAPPDQAAALREPMRTARAEFGRWHLVSVLLNLAVVGLVTAAMAMAAHLPPGGDLAGRNDLTGVKA